MQNIRIVINNHFIEMIVYGFLFQSVTAVFTPKDTSRTVGGDVTLIGYRVAWDSISLSHDEYEKWIQEIKILFPQLLH